MLAHELRNPLAPISNVVELLRRGGSAADLVDWGLDVIGRQTEHLARLVDDLLDILRISRGVIELRPRRLDLAEVVARAVETSSPAIEARRHRLEVVLPEESLQVHGDLVRLRILVVDNNPDAVAGLERLLGSQGHEVLVAHETSSAIELAETRGPDVVLLDMGLPGMDGDALASTLRERLGRSAPRIIALTGYGQPGGGGSASDAFDLCLVKPIDFERLLDLLSGYHYPGEAPSTDEPGLN